MRLWTRWRSHGCKGLFVWTALYTTMALAQADPWTLAQQAFTRFDYASAFKYAQETLTKQPQNQEARRVAARSAKELEKYTDCLRIMAGMPTNVITTDDVGLIGECSAASVVSARVVAFLNQQLQVPENKDMAAFWLGRYLYRKGDYKNAEKMLSGIAVLPDRLEKERVFMLSRIRDVNRAMMQPTPRPVAPVPVVPAQQPLPSPGQQVSPQAPQQQAPRPQGPTNPAMGTKNAQPAPNGVSQSGFFFLPSFFTSGQIELSGSKDRILVEPFTQTRYDQTFKVTDIEKQPIKPVVFSGSALVKLRSEYRSGTSSQGIDCKVGGEIGGAATASNYSVWRYVDPTESLPSLPIGPTPKGWTLKVRPDLQLDFGKYFTLTGAFAYQLNAPDSSHRRQLVTLSGDALLKLDHFKAKGGYSNEVIYGTDNKSGLTNGQVWGDLVLDRLSWFALEAPQKYPLFRYSRWVTNGSQEVVRFMSVEADFIELNIVPRLRLGESLDFYFWYRSVSQKNHQYWSTDDIKKYYGITSLEQPSKISTNVYEATAMYNALSQENSFGITWKPQNYLSMLNIDLGLTYRKIGTSYRDFVPSDLARRKNSPEKYRDLLNSGGETTTRLYAGIDLVF